MKKERNYKKVFGCATALTLAGFVGWNLIPGTAKQVTAEDGPADSGEVYENGWEAAEKDTEYVYCVGSVSKVYSTAAVMQLVDEGKVELDGPVTDYIPEFRMADPRYKDITVRMLMDHTSGLMGSDYSGAFLYGDVYEEKFEDLLKTLAEQRLKADPGEYASYCNDGFDLLAIITERVSGMNFTEYVQKNLAAPTGGSFTGSGATYLSFEHLAPANTAGHNRYEQGGTMCLGAGGVYATASDTAAFGAGFIAGNNKILSENAKTAMATRWSDADVHMEENGLGWDMVSMSRYENTGVTVVGKGGDSGMNHAFLLVAPENEISVSVLSNGGSSMLNGLLTQAIMDVCLEEQGITVTDPEGTVAEIVSEIPAEYDAKAGEYSVNGETGDAIDRISFPEHKYMHVESIGAYKTTCTDYVLTQDGRFAELAYEVADSGIDDIKVAMNPTYISFHSSENGQTLLAADRNSHLPEMGDVEGHYYIGEKLKENPVSTNVQTAWQALERKEFLLAGERYSSSGYDTAFAEIVLPSEYPGYVFVVTAMGTKLLKVTDETHAVSFQEIPSNRNRDRMDITFKEDENGLLLCSNVGLTYRSEDGIPAFDGSVNEIVLDSDQPAWFKIGSNMINTEITITERPEHSAVYVYNKFGEVVYTTHVIGMTNSLPMPEDGYIVFLGQDGTIRLGQ